MTAKPKTIYKYISPEHLEKVFSGADIATLKCSLPKDFNDPYELFLTIDFNERADALAFYADVIGELPQFPTTCFSKSPIVLPMWAHYASNLQGFVVEFSEDELARALPDIRFDDVTYSDTPREDLSEMLHRAYVIGKYRYTYFLRAGVFNAAYFTKATCWSYEQERRMLVPPTNVREAGGLTLLDVPKAAVTKIVAGPRASKQTKAMLAEKAEQLGCGYFELRIGKTSPTPYLLDPDENPYLFDAGELVPSKQHCGECKEPIGIEADKCSWCQIDEELRRQVALRNPYRILDRAGLLDEYIEGMDAITERIKDK